LSQKSHTCHITLSQNHITSHHDCSKCPPPAHTQARRDATNMFDNRDSERPTRCWCVISVR